MALPDNTPRLEMIEHFEQAYILACCLYYTSPMELESPRTDAAHDQGAGFLEYWRHLWSPEFAARIGDAPLATAGHALAYSEQEVEAAIAWALDGSHWPATAR